MSQTLFRQQVLDRQTEGLQGALILSRPLPHSLFTLFLVFLVGTVLVFLARQDYVRKHTVYGALVPDRGLIEIRAPAPGTLSRLYALSDARVEAGAPLFSLRLDHTLAGDGALSESLLDELRVEEAALRQQMHELESLLGNEGQLLAVKTAALERAASLRDRALLAPADYDAVRAQFLQQQGAVGRLLLQQAQMRADAAGLQTQQLRLGAEQATTVVAPLRARVAAVLRQQDMSVAGQEPVLVLLPDAALLQAELWLPSSASGFVNPGQVVKLRYEAFPYQKFGVQEARIIEIAESAQARQPGTPPVFRAIAALERQDILAFGSPRPLRPGMALSADIIVDERSLLEWLLEPLLSIKGKLAR